MSTTTPEYTITVDITGANITWQGQTFTVEPEDLTNGGWEFDPECDRAHCSDGDCLDCATCDGDGDPARAAEALRQWHNEQGHIGKLALCYEEPCKSVAQGLGVWGG
ncbi:hypothetical protein [Nocardioides sp. SR21]|uniref:hypothetical protein n=1 Tax=Nocardioides sp. SR21 TaxID=2919501 RepID=UPI001FAB251A|nr:hypothetical protein [Nocardioides sp. SR21]